MTASHSTPLYDMHCHLDFFEDPAGAAAELAAKGVAALSATVTPTGFERAARELAGAANVRVGVGLHPWWVADGRCGEDDVALAARLATSARFVAEVGLDFAHGRDAARAAQLDALDRVLAACEGGGHVLSLPAVRAGGELLDLLDRHGTCEDNVVILHWFSGSGDELVRAVRMGCHFSVGSRMLATRRGRAYAQQVPLDRLLLETDLPASPEDGTALSPAELAAQLRSALEALVTLRGPDVAARIAATSRTLAASRTYSPN